MDEADTVLHRVFTRRSTVRNGITGGAGKTPSCMALVPLLRALGHQPHILSRGYKGSARATRRVLASDDWQTVGDEALLLASIALTWVGRNSLRIGQSRRCCRGHNPAMR